MGDQSCAQTLGEQFLRALHATSLARSAPYYLTTHQTFIIQFL